MSEVFASQVSLKWQKYKLLEDLGVLPQGYMAKTFHRFSPNSSDMLSHVEEALRLDAIGNERNLYVIKAVPQELRRQLPNFRVEQTSDLAGFDSWVKALPFASCELWVCSTPVGTQDFSVAGRLALSSDPMRQQVLEQVWRCSPRLIDSIATSSFAYSHVRACRADWRFAYQLSEVYVPEGSLQGKASLIQEFEQSVQLMFGQKRKWEALANILFATGVTSISLEYKIIGQELHLFDWDTEDDQRVLARLGKLYISAI